MQEGLTTSLIAAILRNPADNERYEPPVSYEKKVSLPQQPHSIEYAISSLGDRIKVLIISIERTVSTWPISSTLRL